MGGNSPVAQRASPRASSAASDASSISGVRASHTSDSRRSHAAGVLHAVGGALTYRTWPYRPQGAVGAGLVAFAGLCLCGAALFPENEALTVHGAFAATGLICLNLAMLGIGAALLRVVRWLAILAYSAGIAGFIGAGLLLNHAATPGVPIGLAERIADYPGAAMVVVLGVFLMVSAASVRGRSFEPGPPAS
jgi:uncharacterized protein DUF998